MDPAFPARAAVRAENERLEAELIELSGHLNAGEHRFLVLLAEFERRQGWCDGATHSLAHWLQWKLGFALGTAREKVRVAKALEELPLISEAMARGVLSYCKVRALTRVAEPATESSLLDVALHGTGHHVEKLVRGYRRAQQAEELSREARQQASRGVEFYHDDDGSLVLKARLPAEVGALVLKAFEVAREVLRQEHVPAGTSASSDVRPDTPIARRADALALIAESFLAKGAAALKGGDRHQIVVHVDAETLEHKSAGRCELEDGPSVSAETSRRLACDCSLVRITEGEDGEPLNVGRKTRSIPPAIRRALNSRDKGCRFPGCTHARYVDGHHLHHWADGGETSLGNLVLLCRVHHRWVHEGGGRIDILDDGALRFVRSDGRILASGSPEMLSVQSDWTRMPALNRDRGLAIDHTTAASGWTGESMDYGWAVQALLQRRQWARNTSA